MTSNCSIPFLKNWTITLKDVPRYTDFEGEFIEPLDYHIGVLLMESELLNERGKPIITNQMKTALKNAVLDNINKSTGELVVKHNNTYRTYRTCYIYIS